jgi:hypothetical protein
MAKLSFSQIIKKINGQGVNTSVDFQLPDDHRTVLVIDWIEVEKGRGYDEPHGHSLHTNKTSLVNYFNQCYRDDGEYSNLPMKFYLEKVPQDIYNKVLSNNGTYKVYYKTW